MMTEEISTQALVQLRGALDDAEEISGYGNSTDVLNAYRFLARKVGAVLDEVGY